MSICGKVTLEDFTIRFAEYGKNDIEYRVTDNFSGKTEVRIVPLPDFFIALSIAVHPEGLPDYKRDYPIAETVQSKIRWIP